MQSIISFIMGNIPIEMTVLALILSGIKFITSPNKPKPDVLLGYLLFFAVGISGLWGFIFHAFFPEISAKAIGWQVSPFQFEVAVANLGLGMSGIFGLRASLPYRTATTVFTTCFLWGAAYGHIVQMIKAHNFAPGNAGLIFYNDLILPALLIFLVYISKNKPNTITRK